MFFYQEVEQDGSGRQKLFIAFIAKIVSKEKLWTLFGLLKENRKVACIIIIH